MTASSQSDTAETTEFEIVLASRNMKKIGEIGQLLAPHNINIISVANYDPVPDVVEDGETFADNAAKKARETALFLGKWTIGEDSGLLVDALKGKPGVYSARYSGDNATDQSNNEKLQNDLKDVPAKKRGAGYLCHIALSDPEGNIQLSVERTCRGRITTKPRGENGFGYDPYFLIPEYDRTFGELSPMVKRILSHRARAFADFIPQLLRLIASVKK